MKEIWINSFKRWSNLERKYSLRSRYQKLIFHVYHKEIGTHFRRKRKVMETKLNRITCSLSWILSWPCCLPDWPSTRSECGESVRAIRSWSVPKSFAMISKKIQRLTEKSIGFVSKYLVGTSRGLYRPLITHPQSALKGKKIMYQVRRYFRLSRILPMKRHPECRISLSICC